MRAMNLRALLRPLLLGLLTWTLLGCGEEPAPPTVYPVTFRAFSDDNPLGGVQISVSGRPLGQTNEEGTLTSRLTGPEGTSVPVTAQCPQGYRPAAAIPPISLRQVVGLTPETNVGGIEVRISCPPAYRNAVVIIRTDDREGLPILVDGQERGRTDRSGAAHILLARAPLSSFQVRIATESNPQLRPQEPSQTFTLPDADQVFVFSQDFQEEQPPRRRRRRRRATRAARPSPRGPRRVSIPTRVR